MAVQELEQGGQVLADFRLLADVNLPVIGGDPRMLNRVDRPGSMVPSLGLMFRMSSFFVRALGCLTFRVRVIW